MKHYRGIGLMSGTSLDGVDLAYCEFSEDEGTWKFDLVATKTYPFDDQWYARLHCLNEQNAETYARTDVYLGHFLGRMLADFIETNELRPQFVASHGQTIFHQPDRNFTAQIGDGETMVRYLPCPLVCNFRNKDVALGGQGAPLVPFGEGLLFPEHRLFLNLGGFANLTVGEIAFDIAPCNMALNWLTRSMTPPLNFDMDGILARGGEMDYELYGALEALSYYSQKAPKSLGTEWFEANVLPLIADQHIPIQNRLKTFLIHVVSRVTSDLHQLNVRKERLMVTGGGARNVYLMDELEKSLAGMGIELENVSGPLIDYKEAIIFAFLGLHTLLGRPNTMASVTGAERPCVGGSIHLPVDGYEFSVWV